MRRFEGFDPAMFVAEGAAKVPIERRGVTVGDLKKRIVQGAADLMWKHKRQLRRAGVVDFDLPRGASCPAWMTMILEELRLRRGHWAVAELAGKAGGKRFRVRWLGWSKHSRRLRRVK